jgi:NAD(P)-dependent dehydrogenase (short-subunit alcohol dehydrogenase family)
VSDRDLPLTGRTIVITGSSSGLGRSGALELARRGASIAVVGRNPERTAAVAAEAGGIPFIADFDRLDDVRALGQALLDRFPRIDVLVNNAGGLVQHREQTGDGFERTFQANYLSPFLLTRMLLPRIEASGGRVLSTASNSNTIGRIDLADLDRSKSPWLGGWTAYGTTKLETILFIRELARRVPAITAYSFHPGYVASGFGAEVGIMRFAQWISRGHLGLTNDQGAEPLIFLASTPDVGAPSGTYFSRAHADGRQAKAALDDHLAAALWKRSEELVGLSAQSQS